MADAPLPIADHPDLLTPEWVGAALGRAGLLEGVGIAGLEQRPLGTGQMCDSVRLSLTYDGPTEAPATVVAKLPAADPTSRMTGLLLRSYEREVRFYQELRPTLAVRTPHCFYADLDPTTGSFVLLLEDLAPAEQGDQLAGCSPEVAARAIDELVRLHAPRWGDPALLDIEWLHPDPEVALQSGEQLLPVLWDGFRERYADVLPAHVHEAGDALFAKLRTWLTPAEDHRTVVHGDYRLDNLLLRTGAAAGAVAVVDWQTCAVARGLDDVAYFIGAGLLEDDRRAVEEDLVRNYHQRLQEAGVAGYSWERCWTDYRRGTFAGLVMALGASMMVERTERGDQMFLAMASRHARHVLDLDAPALLG